MIMLMLMSGVWYSKACQLNYEDEIHENDVTRISAFVAEGTPVVLVQSLEDAEDLGIVLSEIVSAD